MCPHYGTSSDLRAEHHIVAFMKVPTIGKGFLVISYQTRNSHFTIGHLDVSKKNRRNLKCQFELNPLLPGYITAKVRQFVVPTHPTLSIHI